MSLSILSESQTVPHNPLQDVMLLGGLKLFHTSAPPSVATLIFRLDDASDSAFFFFFFFFFFSLDASFSAAAVDSTDFLLSRPCLTLGRQTSPCFKRHFQKYSRIGRLLLFDDCFAPSPALCSFCFM